MIRPEIDGRIALRMREIAALEADSVEMVHGMQVIFTGAEKARMLGIAADLLEEYIMERKR